jgi:hypothetical protein
MRDASITVEDQEMTLHPLSSEARGTVFDRRQFLSRFGVGLSGIALADLLNPQPTGYAADRLVQPHFAPRAKRVIYLFQSGAPSHLDLFDHKPLLNKLQGTELPDEVRNGQRLTTMSGSQSSFPLAGSPFAFRQHGKSGTWMSDLLPHTAKVVDDLCLVKSAYTEAINHGPAVTFLQTGSQFPGRPSMGAWINYGLGSGNENLPSFVVLVTKNKGGQPLTSRLWGAGFFPSNYQGVRFRSGPDPVLYLNNPTGIDRQSRANMLDGLKQLHELRLQDPLIKSRMAQYELAFRMQASVPEVTDLSDEPEHVYRQYGDDARNPGTYAANCLLARRLAERGVRFIQLYHQGWDQHGNLPKLIATQCRETDQASAALLSDLKQRGLLDDTLVVWGGEFGRTNYCQGKLTKTNFGRDHHPRCFSMWLAGGGIKPGLSFGETDPYGYNVVENPVHVHDLQATILHLLGMDHERLTYKHQGRRYRLTDVHGHVVKPLIA